MKKKDILLAGGILILAFLCWLVPKGLRLLDGNKEMELKIIVAGDVYGTYSLEKDQVIKIQDTNVCEIKDGKVKMTEASCPDHVCIRQGAIDAPGETVVCLPNKVVLEIVSKDGKEAGLDAVVK
ncbi:MAG TPA: NusG domain II-containing protein [Candidatus Blautia stercoravium]|nr:NusG domain II-containing protein [Candidatus Blautia stercoravium]